MIRSILVPLDGSDFAEHALPLAASLARRAGARLHVVHIHQPAPPTTPSGIAVLDVLDLHLRQGEQAYLADVSRRVAAQAPLEIRTALLFGDVCDALQGYAEREPVDLVVMATHGRGPLGRFWLGSVADDLAARLIQPVLLVRPGEGKADMGRQPELKSIVLPLDGTEESERAIEPALELGKLYDAEFTLVKVNQPALLPAFVPEGTCCMGGALERAPEVERRERKETAEYLAGVAARLAARGARVRTHVRVEEVPAEGILEEARADRADLIAMESHGRRGLARLFRGSVADKVVRRGEVPVLVHHTAG